MNAELDVAGIRIAVADAPAGQSVVPSARQELFRGANLILEGRNVRLRVRPFDSSWRLAIEGHGEYLYDPQHFRVTVLTSQADSDRHRAALLGPVLMHALAHEGIHVLHASALALPDGRIIALTAGSGTGKSTFAALAQARGWRRLADDLLPLTRDGAAWVARPHLPQPKLADDEQYPADAPRDVPLAAIVELARGAAACWDDYDAGTVTRLLLTGTVATRTYTAPMLAAHLDFCAAAGRAVAAGQLVAGRLTVADRPDAIGAAVDEALALLAGRLARDAIAPTPD